MTAQPSATRSTEPALWQAIEDVDDGELWETHQTLRARLIDFTRRLWVSAVLAIPLVVLAMGPELFGLTLLPMRLSMWVQLLLATPVVLWAARPFFERGWESLKTRSLNMFTLISLGVGVAYGYSVVATVAPNICRYMVAEVRAVPLPSGPMLIRWSRISWIMSIGMSLRTTK